MSKASYDHVWYFLDEADSQKEKGPFGEVQLMSLAKSHHFNLDTKLRSPTRTKDKWIPAGSVLKLQLIILESSAKKAEGGLE